ncbi:hypothetical protein HO665_07225 [Streptococcus suis]|nr:hypothetical protein [Streptococcus suis]NQH95899.1 hypothetical protein [Streptococcus suis]NQO47027.1 hypothetical protein [Streptococcus suis]WNF84316.1 hypothetical protein RJW52_11635 [Streptococcus suis]
MTFTEEQYNWLAEQSYWVDEGKDDVKYHPVESKTYGIIVSLTFDKIIRL